MEVKRYSLDDFLQASRAQSKANRGSELLRELGLSEGAIQRFQERTLSQVPVTLNEILSGAQERGLTWGEFVEEFGTSQGDSAG